MEAVDVLGGVDRLDRLRLLDVGGERQLDEDPVDSVVGVEVGQEPEQLVLGGVGGQAKVARVDADALRSLLLAPDVDVRGGVVADEHRGEADVAERRDLGRDLVADFRRQRLAVDDLRRHASEVIGSAAWVPQSQVVGSRATRSSGGKSGAGRRGSFNAAASFATIPSCSRSTFPRDPGSSSRPAAGRGTAGTRGARAADAGTGLGR